MVEIVSIELPDVGEARWASSERDVVAVGGYMYRAEYAGQQVDELRDALARSVKAKGFVESERRSQRVEEAAKILYADMTRSSLWARWDTELTSVHNRYKSAAKALLEAIDNGL